MRETETSHMWCENLDQRVLVRIFSYQSDFIVFFVCFFVYFDSHLAERSMMKNNCVRVIILVLKGNSDLKKYHASDFTIVVA